MYGPPPDPRQISIDLSLHSAPLSYLGCVGLAAVLLGVATLRRLPGSLRAIALMASVVVLLTAPLATSLSDAVYGAFPTIDKEGSLLFFMDGVHHRVMAGPLSAASDPAARLIGVHVGHEPLRQGGVLIELGPFAAREETANVLVVQTRSSPLDLMVGEEIAIRHVRLHVAEAAIALGLLPLSTCASETSQVEIDSVVSGKLFMCEHGGM